MKKLNTTDINLASAICVAEDRFQNRLLRFDLDSYAIAVPGRKGAIFAFQSFDFSMILNSFSAPISDFAVLEFSCLINEDSDEDLFEVRVMSDDGVAYSVDSYGIVTELQVLELVDAFGEGIISPVNDWKLDPDMPFNRILISQHLAFQLAIYLEGDRKEEILHCFWREFERAQKAHGSNEFHFLQSEFGTFAANEQMCGRVLFTTQQELLVTETDE